MKQKKNVKLLNQASDSKFMIRTWKIVNDQ